jgi:condensin-2 complex subunit H2
VPNFAQAALLLQNSSNVYGRKVEYLYALVYAALNDLASSSATAKQPKKKGNDIDIDDFDAFDPDVQFLLLDDILPTDKTEGGDKINLHDSSVDLYDNDPNSSLVSLVSRPSVSGTRLSLGGLSVTHMDRSATQIGNTAAAVRTLMSSLNRGGGDAGGGNLRILSDRSDVNHAGILHLPGTAIQSSSQKDPRQSNLGSEAEGHSSVNEQEDMGGAFFDDGDDNDGPGFEMNDNMDVVKPAEAASAHPKLVKFQLPEKPDKADPWSLLDPHDPGPTKGRPIKIGITYKLPLGLEETPSQCVTGASTKKRPVRRLQERPAIKESICFVTATFKATMENGRRRRERMDGSRVISDDSSAHSDDLKIKADAVVLERPVVPIHGLVFGEEFAYIAKAEAKRKASERRDRRKLLVEHPTAVPDKEADALLGYNDHDENGVDFDFGGADDDSFGGDDDGESNQPAMGNTGMASLDDMYCKPDGGK